MRFHRTVFILCSYIILNLLVSSKVWGATEFNTDHIVTYDVKDSGLVIVDQEITITNNTPTFFVSSYKLDINQLSINNVKAYDTQGSILDQVEEEGGITSIFLIFNDKSVGQGSKLSFTISYETSDIASNNGLIWDINIPKITHQDEISSYKVLLNVSKSIGSEIYISPKAKLKTQNSDIISYQFDKNQIQDSSISASFGEYQYYYFKLKYKLRNLNLLSTKQEIALPPDIYGHQKIYYLSISKHPENIHIDPDGNYIASYYLPTGTSKEIELTGVIKVFNKFINIDDGGQIEQLPEIYSKNYTISQRYWDIDNPEIFEKANELTNGKEKITEKAFEIYKYMVNNFSYNYSLIGSKYSERLGSSKAFNNPQDAVCTEFSDTTIALLRSVGIPSRELNGFGYTLDEQLRPLSVDILHSWVEYYDPNLGWIPIDPTWAHTSKVDYFNRMDTNHIVFVRKGLSSTSPEPPGSYSVGGEKEKLIDINITTDSPEDYKQVGVEYQNKSILNLIRKNRIVSIKNLGNVTLFDPVIQVKDGDKVINNLKLNSLPPFSFITVTLDDRQSLDLIKFMDFSGKTQIEKLTIFPIEDKLVLLSRSSILLLTGFFMPLMYLLLMWWAFRIRVPQKLYSFLTQILRIIRKR